MQPARTEALYRSVGTRADSGMVTSGDQPPSDLSAPVGTHLAAGPKACLPSRLPAVRLLAPVCPSPGVS